MLREELAIDVGKPFEFFVKVLLPILDGRVEYLKEVREAGAKIRAIMRSSIFDVELERFPFEQPSVFSEETKENSNEKPFKIVPRVSARFEGIVQITEQFNVFDSVNSVSELRPLCGKKVWSSPCDQITLESAAAVEEFEHVALVRLLPLYPVCWIRADVEPLDVGAGHQVDRPIAVVR